MLPVKKQYSKLDRQTESDLISADMESQCDTHVRILEIDIVLSGDVKVVVCYYHRNRKLSQERAVLLDFE